jgi:acetoin utilization deacetylase AcuC-like enzyme
MTLQVFYDERQNVASNDSFSPSAGKPKRVVDEWLRRGYDVSLAQVQPVTREDFYLAHNPTYVDDILDHKLANGFDNTLPEIAESLPWTTGSLFAATRHALETGENSCSPTSGFHHAHWSSAEGYCTFNALMVTAIKLRNTRWRVPYLWREFTLFNRIGILDLDHHLGNGTIDIIKHHQINYINHYTFGANQNHSDWQGGAKAETWLNSLTEIVEGFKDCKVVIYQAGADPHVNDTFGGALTDAQLRVRDRIVFSTLKAMNIPVAWNLAGGYQEPLEKVLGIHNATLEECLKVMASR